MNVVVTTYANWVAEEITDGLAISGSQEKVFHDYGFDILFPKDDIRAWWLPAAHAARVRRVFPDIGFSAPGPEWLGSVPEDLLGRSVRVSTLSETLDDKWEGKRWLKPSEAKLERFPAQLWTHQELTDSTKSMSDDLSVQYSEEFLNINYEHRFYVVSGEVITGSPYLINNVSWNDGIGWEKHSKALDFAKYAVSELGDNQPHSYTLDVGLDMFRNKWIIIEGNPAWSSGFYGSNIPLVVEAIHESIHSDNSRWLWKPDPELMRVAERKKLLKIVPPVSFQ